MKRNLYAVVGWATTKLGRRYAAKRRRDRKTNKRARRGQPRRRT